MKLTDNQYRREGTCVVDTLRPFGPAIVSCCHNQNWSEGSEYGRGKYMACEICINGRCRNAKKRLSQRLPRVVSDNGRRKNATGERIKTYRGLYE